MNKELTNSQVDRQNILNNFAAMSAIREYIGLAGMLFEGGIVPILNIKENQPKICKIPETTPNPLKGGFQRGNLDTAFSSKDKQKEKKILRSALQKPPFRGLGVINYLDHNPEK